MNKKRGRKQNEEEGNRMNSSKKIESIVIWRVIACLGVFAVHLGQRMNLSGYIRLISDFGKYGVQLFFIISGLLSMEQMFVGGVRR